MGISSSSPQAQMVAKSRAETCLDRNIALGYPPPARPEIGPGVVEYYRRLYLRGERGTYWPLHQTLRRPGIE
jgi:hypothetical protein